MQLQATTHYAVRILLYLARNPDVHKVREIAEAVGITSPMATRIILLLKSSGYIVNVPPQRGSYVLGKDTKEISFYDVLLITEGELQLSHCFKSGIKCAAGNCKAHDMLLSVQADMIERMQNTSIAELI